MTTPQQYLMLMQLTDSMFPIGAFVHSNGLETYTQIGSISDLPALKNLIAVRLAAAGCSEMLIIKAAMEATQKNDFERLQKLDQMVMALKTAYEAREASLKVGRQLLRTTATLFQHDILTVFSEQIQAGRCWGNFPVIYGMVYASAGFDSRTTLLAYAYQLVAGQTSAAAKLMSVGQTRLQALLLEMQPDMEQAVETALAGTLEDYHAFTPALDIRTMQHQYLFRRLFHS